VTLRSTARLGANTKPVGAVIPVTTRQWCWYRLSRR
jgi:hypothetical protein